MNLPIRMIGIATTFFWIFLIGFSATALYSAKDLQYNFGKTATATEGKNLVFSMPINIVNRGLYDIGTLNVYSRISDTSAVEITRGTTLIGTIRVNEEISAFHNLTVDLNDISKNNPKLLFNDTQFAILEAVKLRIADVIPLEISRNYTIPWRAPLYNFTLGKPEITPLNTTHFRVAIPTSFENHASLDLAGSFRLTMYDAKNGIVDSVETIIHTPEKAGFSQSLELRIPKALLESKGHFEIFFSSPLFDYGPWVIQYG